MTNNNKVEWLLDGEIQAACESCKFPRHDGPCESAPSFLNQDKILTLNIGCPHCREEFYRFFPIQRESFALKLTYEERKPAFDSLQMHPDDFKGLSDVKSRIELFLDLQWETTSIDEDELKRQLKGSIHIMSSSGQDLWKTMFGNVEESIHLLWTLHCNSSHFFIHQMAYFLSAIDSGDKASFLRSEIHWIPSWMRTEDMYMLIPSIGFHRIKARIVNPVDEIERGTLDLAFLLFAVKNQRELEQAGELDKGQVRELACKYGVPYVYVNSYPSMFSLDGFCPLKRMKISTPNSSTRLEQSQNVRAIAQLVHKVEVHSQNIEVSINIRNVRCLVLLSDKSSDEEKYFPSRIQIRVIPSKDCEKRTQFLTVGKSGNDTPRPLSTKDLVARDSFGSSVTHTNWRFEMNDCSDISSAGYFEWTLFDHASAVEVWSADSRNYMNLGSSLRNKGSHLSSPFTRDGGCVFSEDLYGQPLTWSLDKRVEGATSSWRVEMDVWLTDCYNVSRNYDSQTVSWTFTESLEMKL